MTPLSSKRFGGAGVPESDACGAGPLFLFRRRQAIPGAMQKPAADWANRLAPSLDDFEAIAIAAYGELPEQFRALVGEVTFAVSEFPEDDVLEELEAETPFDILGLFQGIGMAHGSAVPETGMMPNRIWLYRRPILDYWAEHEESLGAIITHVLIHEIGHHFGLSDDDMEALEDSA